MSTSFPPRSLELSILISAKIFHRNGVYDAFSKRFYEQFFVGELAALSVDKDFGNTGSFMVMFNDGGREYFKYDYKDETFRHRSEIE